MNSLLDPRNLGTSLVGVYQGSAKGGVPERSVDKHLDDATLLLFGRRPDERVNAAVSTTAVQFVQVQRIERLAKTGAHDGTAVCIGDRP